MCAANRFVLMTGLLLSLAGSLALCGTAYVIVHSGFAGSTLAFCVS